jgi:hypothetical protein
MNEPGKPLVAPDRSPTPRTVWAIAAKMLVGGLLCLQLSGCVMACFVGRAMSNDCPLIQKQKPITSSSLSQPAISPDGKTIAFLFTDPVRKQELWALYEWRTGKLSRGDRPADFSQAHNMQSSLTEDGHYVEYKIENQNDSVHHDEIFQIIDGKRKQLTNLHASLYDIVVSADNSTVVFSIGIPSGQGYNDLDLAVLDLRTGAILRPGLLARVRGDVEFRK